LTEQFHGLRDGEKPIDRRVLEDDADALAIRSLALPGIEAEDLDAPGITGPETLENLHGGGLAGSVGPEQCKDLAFGDSETDALHRRHAVVGLAKLLDLDRRHARRAVTSRP